MSDEEEFDLPKPRSEVMPGERVELPEVPGFDVVSAQGTFIDESHLRLYVQIRGDKPEGWQDTMVAIASKYFGAEAFWTKAGTMPTTHEQAGKKYTSGETVMHDGQD